MTFEEKSAWAYGFAALVVPAAYFVWLTQQVRDAASVQDVSYTTALWWAVGAGIVVHVFANAFVRGANTQEADQRDERDRAVGRRADQLSFIVFSVLASGAMILAMYDQPTFWIANSLYASFAVTAVLGAVLRSIFYRKGA